MKKKRNGIKMHFHGEDRNDSGLKVRNGFGDEEWRSGGVISADGGKICAISSSGLLSALIPDLKI